VQRCTNHRTAHGYARAAQRYTGSTYRDTCPAHGHAASADGNSGAADGYGCDANRYAGSTYGYVCATDGYATSY